MTYEEEFVTNFEDLSDEIIISILEYLTLEDFITIFGQLNSRLACIILDHPWTPHQFTIQTSDNQTLEKKLDFIDKMKIIPRISTIDIRPFCNFHTIEKFQQLKPIENFINLRALSLKHITLEEAESIFNIENLSKLEHLTRLRVIFSFGVEQVNYSSRTECLLATILTHPPLRYCTIEAARSITFSQLESPSSIEYLDINYCNFQSLYTLFEYTPSLRHLTAAIGIYNESKLHKITIPPLLNSIKLILSVHAFDELTLFLQRLPKLQKLNIITRSVIEPLTFTTTWSQLITERLPVLMKFKREGNVPLENIEEYMQTFHWPNGWKFEEKNTQNGANYSRITITNTRY